jgi:hypothetical protein
MSNSDLLDNITELYNAKKKEILHICDGQISFGETDDNNSGKIEYINQILTERFHFLIIQNGIVTIQSGNSSRIATKNDVIIRDAEGNLYSPTEDNFCKAFLRKDGEVIESIKLSLEDGFNFHNVISKPRKIVVCQYTGNKTLSLTTKDNIDFSLVKDSYIVCHRYTKNTLKPILFDENGNFDGRVINKVVFDETYVLEKKV